MSDDLPSDPIERLRREIDRDTRILASITPTAEAHRQLSASIEYRTNHLMDQIDTKEEADLRIREALHVHQARLQAQKLTPDQEGRLAGVVFTAVGGVVGYFTWASWWILLAAAMILLGLIATVSPFDEPT